MNKQVEALKLALEALENLLNEYYADTTTRNDLEKAEAAIDALRERLAQPEQKPVAWGVFDGPNLHDVNFTEEEAHEMAWLKGDGSVVKPLYTDTQPQMQPCAGRNCGSTNPNLHSAECFEDYEKATGMNQRKPLTNDRVWLEYMQLWPFRPNEEPTLAKDILRFARAIEAAHGIKGDA